MIQSEIHVMPEPLIQASGTSIIFELTRIVPAIQSEYVQYQKRGKPLDTRWSVDIERGDTDPDDWQSLMAFINRVDGISHHFQLYHPMKEIPSGKATGIGFDDVIDDWLDGTRWTDDTIVLGPGNTYGYINAKAATGVNNIKIRNLVASTHQVLKENDHFSILHGPRRIPTLYAVTRDADSDASGIANVEIAPRLRYPVTEGDIVNFWRPSGIFQFVTQPQIEVTYPYYGTARLQAIETSPEILQEDL